MWISAYELDTGRMSIYQQTKRPILVGGKSLQPRIGQHPLSIDWNTIFFVSSTKVFFRWHTHNIIEMNAIPWTILEKVPLLHFQWCNIPCVCTTKMYCDVCVRLNDVPIYIQYMLWMYAWKSIDFIRTQHGGTYSTAVNRWHENCVQFKILFQSQSIKINRHLRLTWNNLFTVTINRITRCISVDG